ncbi:substrate-binding domain-containing protein [Infirmifilum sp. SLHALR2]|nr:MAG: hypothetical protein B7L53_06460 [Thermofilum sp. NZ13]
MPGDEILRIFSLLNGLRAELTPTFHINGHTVTAEELRVLEAVERAGSIKRAAELLGLDYRTVWNTIARLEEATGAKVVERGAGGPGGGGAHLTPVGEAILAKARLVRAKLTGMLRGFDLARPDVVIAGSDCAVMERLISELAEKGVYGLYLKVGSTLGVEALKMGLSHVAGVHILDPATGRYNEHLLNHPQLRGRVVLVKGWKRVMGLAFNPRVKDPPDSLTGVVERGLRIANRIKGSGTRILLEHLLEQAARELGVPVSALKRRLKGYGVEYTTHREAANAVATGKADVTLTVDWVAREHGLVFKPLLSEDYDLLMIKDVLPKLPLAETSVFKGREGLTVIEQPP